MSVAPAWMNQSLTTPVMSALSNSHLTRTPDYTTCKCNTLITSYDTATISWRMLCIFCESNFAFSPLHFGLQVMQHRFAGGHMCSKPDSFFCLSLCNAFNSAGTSLFWIYFPNYCISCSELNY